MVTRKTKPKCGPSSTACGYACITSKKQCSSVVLARDAAELIKAATQAKPTSLPAISPTLADNDGKSTWGQQLDKAYARLVSAVVGMTGLDKDLAESGTKALQSYVSAGYTKIREADSGRLDSKEYIDKASNINTLVSKLPSYSGDVYRGLSFSSQRELDGYIKSIDTGFTLTSMSSFSSRLSVAESFTSNYSAILKVKANKTGKSISAFNKDQSEAEVLVLKGAAYKTVSVSEDRKGNIVVELEEV